MATDILILTACGAVVVWTLFRIDWRSRYVRYSFATFLCILLVALFRIPRFAQAIDRTLNVPDVGHVLQYLFTTGTAVAWALVCLSIAPANIQKRRWLLALVPFALWPF